MQYKMRTARSQAVYEEYLSKCCVWLEHSFRNTGLLLEIFDHVRNGQQTLDDLDKLVFGKKFPEVWTDYGVHYSKESCSISNRQDLWDSCKESDPPQQVYVMEAGYHDASNNDFTVVRTATNAV